MRFGEQGFTRLPRPFFARPAALVARELIGLVLAHDSAQGLAAGRIVEVEAYLSRGDAASHSFRGRTQRNAAMFGPPGRAYVYLVYGVHHCFNVVTGPSGTGEAVLVRALEPLAGLELMRARRGVDAARDLCRGPGRLTRALAIGRELDGTDLARGPLGLWSPVRRGDALEIATTARIGITRSVELPLRFCATNDVHVSGPTVRSASRAPIAERSGSRADS